MRVAILPNAISRGMAPPSRLARMQPTKKTGDGSWCEVWKDGQGFGNSDLDLSIAKRCEHQCQYNIDSRDQRCLHQKQGTFVFHIHLSPLVLFYEWKVTNTRFIFARLLVKRPCLHGHLTNAAEAYTGRYMAYGRKKGAKPRPLFVWGVFNATGYNILGRERQGKYGGTPHFVHNDASMTKFQTSSGILGGCSYFSASARFFFSSIILSRSSAACSKFRSAAAWRICFSSWEIRFFSSFCSWIPDPSSASPLFLQQP